MDKNKKRQLLFNILIVILVILVFILIDLFISSLKSSPAEDQPEIIKENSSFLSRIFNNEEAPVEEPEVKKPEFTLEKFDPEEKVFVPILNFHHISSAPAGVSKTTASYYIEPAEFEEILKSLIEAGYQAVFVSQMVDWLEQGVLPQEKIIALTFDDGNINFYTNAWPILRARKLKSNIYIMSGVGGKNYLNEAQIIEVVKDGYVELGSHTVWHPKLTQIPKTERLYELEKSKDDLEELIPWQVTVLSYPYGLFNQDIKDLAKAVGYKAALTYDQEAWQDPMDLFELKRISVFPGMNVVKFLDKLINK